MKLKDPQRLLQSAMTPVTHDNAVRLMGTDFLLLPGIHFIAAITKHGKTNCAANVVCDLLNSKPDCKVFVGLNEETSEDFLVRCGCILSNTSFAAWKTGKLSPAQRDIVGKKLEILIQRIRFADEESMNLGCLEDVESAIRKAATHDAISLVVFDYLQNVYLSKNFPGRTQYEISKLLGVRLKDIGKSAKAPVLIFGQLKDDAEAGFKSRVEGDSWFVNNVASGLELIADKATRQSRLVVHIDRFQGKTHDEYWFAHQATGRLTRLENPGIANE